MVQPLRLDKATEAKAEGSEYLLFIAELESSCIWVKQGSCDRISAENEHDPTQGTYLPHPCSDKAVTLPSSPARHTESFHLLHKVAQLFQLGDVL